MGTDSAQPRWSESPWFYLACFCGMGLLALWAASGKYARRQADVESHYRAQRYQLAHDRQVGVATSSTDDAAAARGSTPPTGAVQTIVPLRPLAVPLAAGLAVSLAMLWRLFRTVP